MNAPHGSSPSDSRRKRWGYPVKLLYIYWPRRYVRGCVEYTTRRRILDINGRIALDPYVGGRE